MKLKLENMERLPWIIILIRIIQRKIYHYTLAKQLIVGNKEKDLKCLSNPFKLINRLTLTLTLTITIYF